MNTSHHINLLRNNVCYFEVSYMSKIKVNNKNKDAARKRFGIYGNPNLVLHHVNPNLMYEDPERYNEWRDEDLVVMEYGEHTALHNHLSKKVAHHTEETKKKISESMKGIVFTEEHRKNISASLKGIDHSGEKNSMWGTHQSDEAKAKISKANSGKHRVYREDGT